MEVIKGTPRLYLECEWCNVKKKRMRRAPKWTLKRKMCVDQSKEHQASSSHVDSTFDGNKATSNMKKRTLKLHPRRRIYIEQSEEHQASSVCLESTTSGQAVGKSGGGILTEEGAPNHKYKYAWNQQRMGLMLPYMEIQE